MGDIRRVLVGVTTAAVLAMRSAVGDSLSDRERKFDKPEPPNAIETIRPACARQQASSCRRRARTGSLRPQRPPENAQVLPAHLIGAGLDRALARAESAVATRARSAQISTSAFGSPRRPLHAEIFTGLGSGKTGLITPFSQKRPGERRCTRW